MSQELDLKQLEGQPVESEERKLLAELAKWVNSGKVVLQVAGVQTNESTLSVDLHNWGVKVATLIGNGEGK